MIITIIICVTRIKYCTITCTHAPTAEWVIRIENIKQCWFIACLLTLAVSNNVSEHDGKLLQTPSRVLFFFQYQSWENGLRTSKKKKTDYYTFRFSHYITHNINTLYTTYWYIISVSMLQVNMCDLIIYFIIIINNVIVNLSAASKSRRRLLNTERVMHLVQ